MKINRIQQISFTNCLRIKLKNKTLGNNTPMNKITVIADKNKVSYLVGEDILLLSSSDNIKEDLDIAGINYEEVDDNENPLKE